LGASYWPLQRKPLRLVSEQVCCNLSPVRGVKLPRKLG